MVILALLSCDGSGLISIPEEPCDVEVCDDLGCWWRFCGGTFDMGAADGEPDEAPPHPVKVRAFSIQQTEVTVGLYDRCVAEGVCLDPEALPDAPARCLDRGPDHPRGCLDREMAETFCAWADARLPSEAEWEFAARSGGEPRRYPWGETDPSCALAVLGYADLPAPCEPDGGPALVCSRPDGVTDQGLCDMAGNIYEWVADAHHATYDGAPDDGFPWFWPDTGFWVLRGGGISSDEPVRTTNRTLHDPAFSYSGSGVRCAR